MKKISLSILSLCLILVGFTGCVQVAEPVEYDLQTLSNQLKESGAFSDILSPVTLDIAAQFYGIETSKIAEYSMLCSTGATTEEIALFKCTNVDSAAKVMTAAKARVETQRTTYESYAPGEMPKLDDAIVIQNDVYVFYIVSADASKAQTVLDSLK